MLYLKKLNALSILFKSKNLVFYVFFGILVYHCYTMLCLFIRIVIVLLVSVSFFFFLSSSFTLVEFVSLVSF